MSKVILITITSYLLMSIHIFFKMSKNKLFFHFKNRQYNEWLQFDYIFLLIKIIYFTLLLIDSLRFQTNLFF